MQRKSQPAWSAFLTTKAFLSVKGGVMKTDTVLTTDEYFAACCAVPKRVNPPKRTSISGTRGTVAGATGGAIPAQIALNSGSRGSARRPTSFVSKTSELNKNGIRNCIRRSRDDGVVCADHRVMLERT